MDRVMIEFILGVFLFGVLLAIVFLWNPGELRDKPSKPSPRANREPPRVVEEPRIVQTHADCPRCGRSLYNASAKIDGQHQSAWFCWNHSDVDGGS